MDASSPKNILLITYPRSASNLLVRILNLKNQPTILSRESGGYFFLPIVLLSNTLGNRGLPLSQWPPSQRTQMQESYQSCFDALTDHLVAAQTQRKMAFVKEHAEFMVEPTAQTRFVYSREMATREPPWEVRMPEAWGGGESSSMATHSTLNETVLPDAFLRRWWRPVFLIRNPMLVFPSHLRAIRDTEGVAATQNATEMKAIMTIHWSRRLYDFYSSAGQEPIVLEADDLMTEPRVVRQFCELVGLDPQICRFQWESKASDAHEDPLLRRFQSTILGSSGIVGGKTAKGLTMAVEFEKWKLEFGEEEAFRLQRWADGAMADYDFLKGKRLRVDRI